MQNTNQLLLAASHNNLSYDRNLYSHLLIMQTISGCGLFEIILIERNSSGEFSLIKMTPFSSIKDTHCDRHVGVTCEDVDDDGK